MYFRPLAQFHTIFGGQIQRRRSRNTLKRYHSSRLHSATRLLFVTKWTWRYIAHPSLLRMLFPFRVASMPAVRYDLSGGLPTCLWLSIYQDYSVICISKKLMWTWYGTCIFLLNKLCLSLSNSVELHPQMYSRQNWHPQSAEFYILYQATLSGPNDFWMQFKTMLYM